MKALKTSVSLILSFLIVISVFFVVPFSVYGAENNYALSYNVGPYVFNTNTDGTATANFDGKTLYYSDDFDDNSIGSKLPKLDNQNVVYELHNSRITNVYTIPEVITPKVTVSHSVKDGIVYRNGKFSHNSFDLNVSVKPELSEKYQKDDLLWFLSNDEKNRLYATLTKLEIQPSGGVDFGSSGWWLWKDYQTNISESFNDRIKVNESKDYKYTINLQNDKAVSQSEYNIEIYTTPTFDFGSGTRQTSKIRVGNLDYQGDRAEEKKLNSVSGKAVTQASSTLNGMSSAIQFSKNYLSLAQTKQVNQFVDLWLSELILAKYAHKSELKEQVSDEVVKLFFKKLGVDTGILTLPGTIQATTYLQTKSQNGTSIFIEFTVKMMDFDFGNSDMPTMATGSGTATIYNLDGEKLDSSVILPAYADVCAFCTQLQKVAKSTILNGIDSYRTIFGINKEALAEALSSQIMAKILNNSNKKDYFNIISSDTVRNALKKAIETGDSTLTERIFELAVSSSQKSTRVSVKCPVDVVVYDNDGKICGEVRNNIVDTSYNDVFISVVGDQKNIYLVGDDYSFKLVGNDTGTMDYDVTEFDESGKELRTISYKNLTLSDSCKYTSYVPEALNHSSKLFDVIDKDGNIISPTSGGDYSNENITASGKCGENVYYKLYNDGTLKIYGSGDMWKYSEENKKESTWFSIKKDIKSVVIDKGVTSIGYSAFEDCESLESVKLSDSITIIDDDAFYRCISLTSITIPNSVTSIEYGVFESCTSLTSITIPNSVTSIGWSVFKGCTNLKSITIPDSVNSSIGDYAFCECTGLSSVKIGNSVSSINQNAFLNCTSLTSISIGNSVTSIGYRSFEDCKSLTDIIIPDSVTAISDYAFYNCASLTNVTIGNSVTSIGIEAFKDCESLTSVTIPDSVTSIGDSAFSNCECLVSATIPDSVTSMGNRTFYYCTALKDVIIGDGVRNINKNTFYNCKSLESISIGKNVSKIWDGAFYNCESLTKVNIKDVEEWCKVDFEGPYNKYQNNPIYYANNLYLNGELVTDLVIPDSVTSINADVFYNCTSITNVEFGKNVTNIGESAFHSCSNLKELNIPNSVINIGKEAFSWCENLIGVTIGNNVSNIGWDAFYGCKSLTKVNIKDIAAWCKIKFNLEEYSSGEYANPLYYAHNLYLNNELVTDLVIPDNVSSIGAYAFVGCTSITNLNTGNNVTSIGSFAFLDSNNLKNVTIGKSVKSIADGAFQRCLNLENITISNSVKSIGRNAFERCTSIYCVNISNIGNWCNISFDNSESNPLCYYFSDLYLNGKIVNELIIPNSVTTIGKYSFYHCDSLTSVKIPDSVTDIGNEAFSLCTSLTNVYYSGTKEKWSKIEIGSDNLILLNATIHFGKDSTISQKTIKTNTLSVTSKTKTIKLKNLKKKAQTVKAITVKKAKGKVTYRIIKNGTTKKIRKHVKINKKGAITFKKWKKVKKGNYMIKVRITAAGNSTYQSKTITKTIKIKVI